MFKFPRGVLAFHLAVIINILVPVTHGKTRGMHAFLCRLPRSMAHGHGEAGMVDLKRSQDGFGYTLSVPLFAPSPLRPNSLLVSCSGLRS